MSDPRTVAVLGAGSWGTAFASILAADDNDVRVWGRRQGLVDQLNAGVNEVLKQPDVQARFKTLNVDYRHTTPEEFKSFITTETEKWGKIVHEASIKLGGG